MTSSRRRFSWRAAIAAGIIAGVIFIVLEMVLVPVAGLGTPWVPIRMIAAIVLGPDVLPPPDTFSLPIFVVAMLVHFSLSILYANIYAVIWRGFLRFSVRLPTALPQGLFGLVIYLINFYGFTALFPWFAGARNWISILTHITWGLILPIAYEACDPRARSDPRR